jgi:hypothetical protein
MCLLHTCVCYICVCYVYVFATYALLALDILPFSENWHTIVHSSRAQHWSLLLTEEFWMAAPPANLRRLPRLCLCPLAGPSTRTMMEPPTTTMRPRESLSGISLLPRSPLHLVSLRPKQAGHHPSLQGRQRSRQAQAKVRASVHRKTQLLARGAPRSPGCLWTRGRSTIRS